MKKYEVYRVDGSSLGIFDGESPDAAIEAMYREAGYASAKEASEAIGEGAEALAAVEVSE